MYVSRGLAARQPIAPGGVRLWGRFRVRGGGTTPEDNSENISRIFVGSVHACTCFSRCAHCVLGVPVRLLRVSLLHMSPFLNIIPSHSNVLLHMSQSRALQMIAQTLFILLFPSLNSNFMLHAIFVVGISHGIHIAYDWAKVISSFYKRATAVPLVVGFPKCAALFVCLYQQVQHVCCSILFYLGFVMWSLFLDSRGSKALMKTYCVGLALFMLLPVSAVLYNKHTTARQGRRGRRIWRSLAVPAGGPRAVRENPGGWLTTSL